MENQTRRGEPGRVQQYHVKEKSLKRAWVSHLKRYMVGEQRTEIEVEKTDSASENENSQMSNNNDTLYVL